MSKNCRKIYPETKRRQRLYLHQSELTSATVRYYASRYETRSSQSNQFLHFGIE